MKIKASKKDLSFFISKIFQRTYAKLLILRCKGTMFFLYLQIFLVKKCKNPKIFYFVIFYYIYIHKYNKLFYLLFVPKKSKKSKIFGCKIVQIFAQNFAI